MSLPLSKIGDMKQPRWEERSFEGRLVRMTRLSAEEKIRTSWGTRHMVLARVEILDGIFAGSVYDEVPIFAPPLKAALLECDDIQGRLKRGPRLEGAPVQWVLREAAA